jgi:hypothetical protein
MAKIFYVSEKTADYNQINFFKTEKEALKYGISQWPDFDMFGDPDDKEDSYEEDNDIWWEGEFVNTQSGILMTWEEDRIYLQSADDEEARKFIRSAKHDKQGSAIFFDSFKKGMNGSLGNDLAEGEGYTWKHHKKEYIKESITTMRNVKLFEDFVNEYQANTKTPYFKELVSDMEGVVGAADYKKMIGAMDKLLDDWYAEGYDKGDILNFFNAIIPGGPND